MMALAMAGATEVVGSGIEEVISITCGPLIGGYCIISFSS
jgi:hypothetical protein